MTKTWTGRIIASLTLVAIAGCRNTNAPAPAAAPVETRGAKERVVMNEKLEAAFVRWEQEGPTGDPEHRQHLGQLADAVRARLAAGKPVDLLFVCTHNSRRSHMAQLLGLAAARRTGLEHVRTFSGGTEATAFNPRAIAALQRVGFEIDAPRAESNPRYAVRLSPAIPQVEAFSKRLTEPPNPTSEFVAVMTCSQADAACPFVPGAAARLAVPYEDPKVADGTPEEAARYDERVAQIGRDLTWVFASATASR